MPTSKTAALRFSYAGVTSELVPALLGARDSLAVRQATGLALEQLLQPILAGPGVAYGLDTVAVLWWLARRHQGDTVTFDAVCGLVTQEAIGSGLLTIDLITDDNTDGEASPE